METLSKLDRYHKTRDVTVIGGVVDLVLGVLKIMVGLAAHSQALIADGVHSLSDLVTDMMVIWAARQASKAPDIDHPYGHQRIETLGAIILGLMLVAVAIGILFRAGSIILLNSDIPVPGFAALVVAGISVVSKEGIYRYTMVVANQLDSELLRNNAWHSRSDAFSSIVVIVGVAGAIAGFPILDGIAAIVVAGMIIWVGGTMVWRGILDLIDTGVSPETQAEIKRTVKAVEGVRDIHDLRTRKMGSDVYLDGHVLVNSKISVSEGHRISEAVRHRLKLKFPEITDTTIHIDGEDDESHQNSATLPLREEVENLLDQRLHGIIAPELVTHKTLHYLDGELHIEIRLPIDQFNDLDTARSIKRKLQAAIADIPKIKQVDVLFG